MTADQRDRYPTQAGPGTGANRLALWSIALTALSIVGLLLRGRPFPYPVNVFVFMGGLVAAAVLALVARRRARGAAGGRMMSMTALVLVAVVMVGVLGLIGLLWLALRNFQ